MISMDIVREESQNGGNECSGVTVDVERTTNGGLSQRSVEKDVPVVDSDEVHTIIEDQ